MRDSINNTRLGQVRIPKLKGHTKITLTDVKTGEVKIVEKDNMVTGAIAAIFANNYANSLNTANAAIMPIRNLFGGVLCFNQQLTENSANIFPPSETENPLIAHAGDQIDATEDANPKQGQRNGTESGEITNGWKWVFDFTTSQGNGTISSVGLCSGAGGNVGTTPTKALYNPTIVADNYNLQFAASVPQMLDGNNVDYTKFYPIKYDSATGLFTAVYISPGTSSTADNAMIRKIHHDVSLFGLNLGVNDWLIDHDENDQEIVQQVVLIHGSGTGLLGNNYGICTDGTYIYIVRKFASNQVEVWKIGDEDTVSVTSTVYTIGGGSVGEFPADPSRNSTYSRRRPGKFGYIPIHDGCLYVPTSDYSSFYKLDLTSGTATELESNHEAEPATDEPAYWLGNVCYGSNYIINGNQVYPMAITPKPTCSNGGDYFHHCMKLGNSNSLLDTIKADSSARPGYQCTTINGLYLATIQNLSQPITKSSSQTMKIEYSLTEVRT